MDRTVVVDVEVRTVDVHHGQDLIDSCWIMRGRQETADSVVPVIVGM
jgi:hypothetical protein